MTCASELALCTPRVRKHIKNISNQADFALVVAPVEPTIVLHCQSVSVEYARFITFFKFILTVSDCVGHQASKFMCGRCAHLFTLYICITRWPR